MTVEEPHLLLGIPPVHRIPLAGGFAHMGRICEVPVLTGCDRLVDRSC